jgi:hypothetical protein
MGKATPLGATQRARVGTQTVQQPEQRRPSKQAGFQPRAATMNSAPATNPGGGITFNVNIDPRYFNGGQPNVTISVGQPVPTRQPTPVARVAPVARRARGEKRTYSIGESFRELMHQNALIHQTDWRLANRGLLVQGGGLCATTSAVNILHAAFHHLGCDTSEFRGSGDLVIHRLVEAARRHVNVDSRMGIFIHSLGHVINEVAQELSSEVGIHTTPVYRPREPADLQCDADALNVLSVQVAENTWHALVVLEAHGNTITYSDPNYPNDRVTRRLESYGGKLRMSGWGGYGEIRSALKIRAKPYDASDSNRRAAFANKRVWLTNSEGRRSLASLGDVHGPTPKFPEGRVNICHKMFGGSGSSDSGLDWIRDLEEVFPPDPATVAGYEELVGKKVKIEFADPHHQRLYGDIVFDLEEVTDEVDREAYPFGGLRVQEHGKERWQMGKGGVISFEDIASIEEVGA